MSSRITSVLNEIVNRFESGNVPDAIAISSFPVSNVPSSRWSFLNRLIMYVSGTIDARGFRQWQQAKRQVKKGAKAFYILVPNMQKIGEDDKDKHILRGFMARPVFRYEDTSGKPITYNVPDLPDLPLLEKAKEWGIEVKAIPGNYQFYGYYSKANSEIALATKEESVFFHELAHAAHAKINRSKTSKWAKEVVAELSAAALCRIVGKTSKHLGNSYRYIKHYASKAGLTPTKACLDVLREVEQTIKLILPGTPTTP